MAAKKKNEPNYTEASGELDEILDQIEQGTTDVDVLSEKVERAAALIKICRDKLANTEMKVEKVVADLSAGATDQTKEA